MNSAQETISRELANGETILWLGEPRQGIMFSIWDILMIPLWLFSLAFSLALAYGFIDQGKFFFGVFCILMALVFVYLLVGHLVLDAKKRKNTFYSVTTRRVIIADGITRQKVRSVYPNSYSVITMEQESKGRGSIYFGKENPVQKIVRVFLSTPPKESDLPKLKHIKDAERVYKLIQGLRNDET